jgi:hypothetical protein
MKKNAINLNEIEKKLETLDFSVWETCKAIPAEIENSEIAQAEEVIFRISQIMTYLQDSKERLETAIRYA